MRSLSFAVILLSLVFDVVAQSPHGKGFKIECSGCHNSGSWKDLKVEMAFNHDSTGFSLVGQHRQINCKACHQSLDFMEKRTQCSECHTDIHQNTVGKDCARCHTPKSWIIENVSQLHQMSRFPLYGAHRTANCAGCHKSFATLQFEHTGIDCVDCHNTNYQQTTNPNHVQGGFPTQCTECHEVGSTNWNSGKVNHDFFPLTGGHNVGCILCHKNGLLSKIPTDCKSCHLTNFNQAALPNHVTPAIPQECATCHTPASWKPSSFNHSATGFALTGAHLAIVQCSDCHKGNLTSANPACVSCHQSQYNSAPQHVALKYPNDCTKCHTSTNWIQVNFNHANTNFPLVGAHTTVACNKCHVSTFTGTPTACVSCHLTNFNQAALPNHIGPAIPTDCATCHTPTSWKPSSFNHTTTGFPLTGSHAAIVQCSDCHKGKLTGLNPACTSCHQAQYNTASQHVALKYPTDCTKCHSTTNWIQVNFNHATTNFPLVGAHTTVACNKCHTTKLAGTPTACISCHQAQYNTALNHVSSNYPADCTICHSAAAWTPVTFNHSSTSFPLTGAHTTVTCNKCHPVTFPGTPTTCVSCHLAKYNSTTNPNHASANFPTNCESCHTTTAWTPANYNHDAQFFPIYSGKHKGVWSQCSECHTTSNYANYSCILCHEHSNKASVDSHHSQVRNYSYTSTACYSCHPQGRTN